MVGPPARARERRPRDHVPRDHAMPFFDQMIADPAFYAVAVPAVLAAGLAKGGLGGFGMLSTPLLALAVSPLQAAAILLPILLVMDATAVWAYWRVYDWRSLVILIPASLIGIGAGWAVAASVDPDTVRLVVGAIAVGFALNHWFGARGLEPARHNPVKGTFWAAVSGFTSFVAHAGLPPLQVYMLPLQLDRRIFAGTCVLFFAFVNAAKVVPYFLLGQFSAENLATAAVLAAAAPLATVLGARLVRVVPHDLFYRLTFALLFLVGVKLMWDGGTSVLGLAG